MIPRADSLLRAKIQELYRPGTKPFNVTASCKIEISFLYLVTGVYWIRKRFTCAGVEFPPWHILASNENNRNPITSAFQVSFFVCRLDKPMQTALHKPDNLMCVFADRIAATPSQSTCNIDLHTPNMHATPQFSALTFPS